MKLYKLLIGVFACSAVFFLACEEEIPEEEIPTESSKTPLSGSFSYSDITGTKGTALEKEVHLPEWKDKNDAKQTIIYTINTTPPTNSFNFKLATGLDFDSTTGAISGTPTVLQASTKYTVTATGTGSYTGSISTDIAIEITLTTIGRIEYTIPSIQGVKGSAIAESLIRWVPKAPEEFTTTYAIDPPFTDELGLVFDTSSGKISGIPKTVLASTEYTITATLDPQYADKPSAIVQIEITTPIIGSFSYSAIAGIKGSSIGIIKPQWQNDDPVQQIRYTINTTTPTDAFNFTTATGLDFDSTTGAISGMPTVLQTSTEYTITAIAIAPYTDPDPKITATVSIEITTPIIGSFSYSAIAGIKDSSIGIIKPQWQNDDPVQQIRYTINTTTPTDAFNFKLATGLDFDSTTGAISGTLTVLQTSTEYTITAIAIAPYTDPDPKITATVSIEITTPITGSFRYSAIAGTKGSSIGIIKPQWQDNDPVQQIRYTINTTTPTDAFNFKLATGLDFDSTTGAISGMPTVLQTSTEYTITAIAIAPYADPDPKITATISIEITTPIKGSFRYSAIAGTKGNSIVTIKPQWQDNDPAQQIRYTINTTTPTDSFNFTTATGLDFDSTTGAISGIPTVLQTSTEYTIRAIAIAPYTDPDQKITATVSIKISMPIIGSFRYSAIAGIKGSSIGIIKPQWQDNDPVQQIRYTINTTTPTDAFNFKLATGLDFDSTTGTISGTLTVLQTSTDYTITAIAIAPYADPDPKITATVSIEITTPITGSFRYSAIAGTKGNSIGTIKPQWQDNDPAQQIRYTINTTTPTDSFNFTTATGLDFDSTTGAISGMPTVPQTSTEYTIRAIAIAPYTDPDPRITATVSIEITTPIIGSFSYSAIAGTKGMVLEKKAHLPQWLNHDPTQQQRYTINTNPPRDSFNFTTATGLDFDTITGDISGTPTVLQTSTEYTITAIAIYPYTDPDTKITTTISIEISTPITITGSFGYDAIAGTKGNNIGTISPQWKDHDSSQTQTYTISPTPPSWVIFNTSNGDISGTPTEATRGVFLITATGMGQYGGSLDARLQITIRIEIRGSFDYSKTTIVAIEDTTEVSATLAWTGVSDSAQKIIYSIHPPLPKGLVLDPSSGAISGMPTAVAEASTKNYRIEARGPPPYKGTISATSPITITITPLVSYSSIANGSTDTSSPVFNGSTPNGLGYSIATTAAKDFAPSTAPTLPTINSTTGEIRVTNATTAGTYVVSISGSGYSGKDKVYFYVTTSPSANSELKTAINTGIGYFGDSADYNYILTSSVTDMNEVFESATSFDGDISRWDTSSVSNMSNMFYDASTFNGDISLWDTSSVESMHSMFYDASTFNGDISRWDTSSLNIMRGIFWKAIAFDGDISHWDTSSATDMVGLFQNASSFNGDISRWDTSSVSTMRGMFNSAIAFDGDISLWDTSSVTSMESMFKYTPSFDGDISLWDTSSVSTMRGMFNSATSFDGDISLWDTSSVSTMESMFGYTNAFNGDISLWDTSSVSNMKSMFSASIIFNGDILLWDTSSVTNMHSMFKYASAFTQNLDDWAPKLHSSLDKTDMFVFSGLAGNEPCWYSTTDDNDC